MAPAGRISVDIDSSATKVITTDVVIVGAGLSGLKTAIDLRKKGISCVVLEAINRVGGKTLTVEASPGSKGVVDLGAAWINDTTQSEIYQLATRFGLELKKQRTTGNNLIQIGEDIVIQLPYPETVPDSEFKEKMFLLVGTINHLVEQSDLEHPGHGQDAAKYDQVTLDQFAVQTTRMPEIVQITDALTSALLGLPSSEVSLLYMLNYLQSGTGFQNLVSDVKDGAQHLRCRQGMQSISKGMAKELAPDTVYLSTPVTRIEQQETGCTVKTSTAQIFKCKKVVVSIPSPLYSSIGFSPTLPPSKLQLSNESCLGYWSKLIFVFDTPWWRDANLSGDSSSPFGYIAMTKDTSIEEDNQWSITCFVVGPQGREWSELSEADRTGFGWKQFAERFGHAVDTIPKPINTIEMEWSKEPYFWGAPVSVTRPGSIIKVGDELRAPFGDIHFVGTETAVQWKGYMDGAVRSGIRGADEIAALLR